MTLYSLYEIAIKNNIEIVNMPLKASKAKIVKCYGQTCIAIDRNQLIDTEEEKQILMTCFGYYFTNSLYSIHDNIEFVSNCNYVATKWVCNNLF